MSKKHQDKLKDQLYYCEAILSNSS